MARVSLSLRFLDLTDAASSAAFREVADTATRFDGYHPFNEQSLLDAAAGRRRAALIMKEGAPVGGAILGDGELDLVILPAYRGNGLGTEAAAALLGEIDPEAALTAWAHGDHPAARALALRSGFAPVRTLLQLRMPLGDVGGSVVAPASEPGVAISAFRPGVDDAEWVALNALIFASHPEQGAVTLADLADRRAEPWFDAGDFLLARETSGNADTNDAPAGTGRLIGYNWLKIDEPDADGHRLGEIYVIGVHPDAAGRGLGRILMQAGLRRLIERGCTTAALYVEADNEGAVHLYRSLGFVDHTIDMQYRR